MLGDRPMAVRVRGVTHVYGSTQALQDISVDLPIGSTTALVGPDGVGKSTFLGLIAGLRRLQTGSIEVFDGDVRRRSHRDRIAPRIAYMPQGLGRNLYPSLSVFENIDFIGRLFGLATNERHERIARLLGAVGLAGFEDRPTGKLSGGMKQKLSLCNALIHDPDLLILDEPTTGIDPLSRRHFWSLIDGLKRDRPYMTVVVATAYMEEAERFDRIMLLDQGRLIFSGSQKDVLSQTGAATLDGAYEILQSGGEPSNHGRFEILARIQHDGPPAIRAEALTRRFGTFTAVDQVSFSIERGEIFGFLGSNGCGKTTTMKMLTGLLPMTSGRAWLLGTPVEAADIAIRLRVGYMSQSFSLYEELTVRANLKLHARLYQLPVEDIDGRVAEAIVRFGLDGAADALPSSLPLGQRQRLQLAVACLHKPEMLILDEPTSGVDPAARDQFWRILLTLSRRDGVTIFVSTHFMSEAERCDRVSLMHAGKVLVVGTPAELISAKNGKTLDDAFVAYLEAATERAPAVATDRPGSGTAPAKISSGASGGARPVAPALVAIARIWAFARREALELIRDRIRIAFALLGPIILIVTFGYGITFDVENLAFAVHDRDQSADSRLLVEAFTGSRYFVQRSPVAGDAEGERRLRSGELRLLISIPPGFGRDLQKGSRPEIGFLLDGATTFRAETARGYISGIMQAYVEQRLRATPAGLPSVIAFDVEPRFRYNQDFKTVFAIMPGIIMMIMAMIPSMLAAIGVVRERELGSITNLYASPATVGQFLLGKQLPYIVLSYISFISLLMIALFHFGLSVKGSWAGLLVGALLYVVAMTAFGILVSSFVRTQVAALIATPVICQVPALNFSGFLYPAATLEGSGWYIGHGFPALWFQNICLGAFAKARNLDAFTLDLVMLLGFAVVFIGIARRSLAKQEP